MTVGATPVQADLLRGSAAFVAGRVAEESVWELLHRDGRRMFGDEFFADLYSDRGRRSIPPQVVATVMVLQRLFGLSDREAVEAFEFDMRWKYAAGGLDLDFAGFAHTVLVDMRARLAASDDPRRIFEASMDAARQAGLVGMRRALDSTPLYDAVATQDTITLIRSAIRGLCKVAGSELEAELRAAMVSGDEYASNSKPYIDWDDAEAREALIDAAAKDAYRALTVLDGRDVGAEVAAAGELLATVVGQDLEVSDDGTFRIARRVAKDRVISTVDPDARHGHKTSAHGYDGFKGHIAVDPDSEIITDTEVSAANVGDGAVAADLIDDLTNNGPGDCGDCGDADDCDPPESDTASADSEGQDTDSAEPDTASGCDSSDSEGGDGPKAYGDSAYGSGQFQQHLEAHGIESGCKTQPTPKRPNNMFNKARFDIDLDADTVTCPDGVCVTIRRDADGNGTARFATSCDDCPLAMRCTTAAAGRTITVGVYEAAIARARQRQQDPNWKLDYRQTRPKVERKIAHLMFRRHGGRRARVRGRPKVDADFNLLAAAANIARLAALGVHTNGAPTAA